jgi:sulfofructose kinase
LDKSSRVLGIGESVLDKYVIEDTTNNTHDPASTHSIDEMHIGGPALSAIIFLSRAGVACDFMTGIGQDAEAEIIAKALRKEGVTLKGNPQDNTKVNTVLVDSTGQRRRIRSTVSHTPLRKIDTSYLSQFDLIIIDRHQRDAFYDIMRKKKASTKVVIDPSTEVSDFTIDMIRQADYPIVPIESVAQLGEKDGLLESLAATHSYCDKPLIVTLGEFGSLIYSGQRLELIPPLPIRAVDTNGAGDIFRGAFAYGASQDWDLRECAHFANVAAALVCTKVGNVTAIPTKAEISHHLKKPRRNIHLRDVDNYFRRLLQDESLLRTNDLALSYS